MGAMDFLIIEQPSKLATLQTLVHPGFLALFEIGGQESLCTLAGRNLGRLWEL